MEVYLNVAEMGKESMEHRLPPNDSSIKTQQNCPAEKPA